MDRVIGSSPSATQFVSCMRTDLISDRSLGCMMWYVVVRQFQATCRLIRNEPERFSTIVVQVVRFLEAQYTFLEVGT